MADLVEGLSLLGGTEEEQTSKRSVSRVSMTGKSRMAFSTPSETCILDSITSPSREVAKYIAEFGRIEFVVSGAAGNLLCPINQLSSNAFKLVVKIDLLGTYNTVKAT
ncbi:hypothetical protein PCANC_03849 [Puccinia coronata f. sp. avenae]|uniref:Uncharacterized protein n=1 Tax=Puccinia coronata f. sp. avenae TaxID=200324 RepID=A0A2N5T7G6_9BASI|nr:hypothetical protein PCANC_03849 [Puccinia coronata f. sp. avenae]